MKHPQQPVSPLIPSPLWCLSGFGHRMKGMAKKKKPVSRPSFKITDAICKKAKRLAAQAKVFEHSTRMVVAIDPAVTNNPDSDETGPIVNFNVLFKLMWVIRLKPAGDVRFRL